MVAQSTSSWAVLNAGLTGLHVHHTLSVAEHEGSWGPMGLVRPTLAFGPRSTTLMISRFA
jgi:hypothetical protein